MKAALTCLALCSLLAGCAIGQQLYDEQRLDECHELPTFDEQLDCVRAARDAESGVTEFQR